MSTAPVSRRERRRQETADRIAEAAAALFGERGFAAATVAEICERADVARQTFFNHFATKQDLVEELARRGHDFVLDFLERAMHEATTTEGRIARFFALVHEAAVSVGPMHLDLVSEVTRSVYGKGDPARLGSLRGAMQKLLRAGRAQGDVSRRHTLEDQATLVLGAHMALVFEWTQHPDFPIAERCARMARVLADALAP